MSANDKLMEFFNEVDSLPVPKPITTPLASSTPVLISTSYKVSTPQEDFSQLRTASVPVSPIPQIQPSTMVTTDNVNAPTQKQVERQQSGYKVNPAKLRVSGDKKFFRRAADIIFFNNNTLADWPDNDFRLFIGNLGKKTKDDVLTALFSHYPSFNRAKVIWDKRKDRTKGYGFVSFMDPLEAIRAMKEQNGKFCGDKPMMIQKGQWKKRDEKVVKIDERKLKKSFKEIQESRGSVF
ncbi:hypothetical protein WA158_004426 [Blastocystis sp. Blastoise]